MVSISSNFRHWSIVSKFTAKMGETSIKTWKREILTTNKQAEYIFKLTYANDNKNTIISRQSQVLEILKNSKSNYRNYTNKESSSTSFKISKQNVRAFSHVKINA